MKRPVKVKNKKVLFLCTGNSARSIMAEAILNHLGCEKYQAYSAGSRPFKKIDAMTIRSLEAHSIPTTKLRSKSWDEYAGKDFDIIVTVCNNAAQEGCPVFPAQFSKLHWDIPEPGKGKKKELEKLADFFRTYRMINRLIKAHFLGQHR